MVEFMCDVLNETAGSGPLSGGRGRGGGGRGGYNVSGQAQAQGPYQVGAQVFFFRVPN